MFYDPAKVDPYALQEFMPWLSKADITTPSGKDIYETIVSAGLDQQLGSVWQPDYSNFNLFGYQAWDPYSSLSLENEGVRGLYTQALRQTQDSRLMDAFKSAMGYDQYKPDPYAYTSFGGGNYGLSIGQLGIDFSKMFESPEFVQAAKTWATEQTAAAQQKDMRADLQNKLFTDPNFIYQTTMEDWKSIAKGAGDYVADWYAKNPYWNTSFGGDSLFNMPPSASFHVGYLNGVPVYTNALTGAPTIGPYYSVDSSGNLTYGVGKKGKGGFFREHIVKYIPKEIRRYVPAIGSVIGTILGAGNPVFAALGSGIGSLLVGASAQQVLTNAGISAVASYLAGGNAWSDVSDALIGDSLVGSLTPAEIAAQEMAEQATTQALVDQGINPYYLDAAKNTGYLTEGMAHTTDELLNPTNFLNPDLGASIPGTFAEAVGAGGTQGAFIDAVTGLPEGTAAVGGGAFQTDPFLQTTSDTLAAGGMPIGGIQPDPLIYGTNQMPAFQVNETLTPGTGPFSVDSSLDITQNPVEDSIANTIKDYALENKDLLLQIAGSLLGGMDFDTNMATVENAYKGSASEYDPMTQILTSGTGKGSSKGLNAAEMKKLRANLGVYMSGKGMGGYDQSQLYYG